MKRNKLGLTKSLITSAILSAGLSSYAVAMEEIVVKGDLGSLNPYSGSTNLFSKHHVQCLLFRKK